MSAELLFAGKYAAFVLPAYGVTILGLGGAIVLSWSSYRRALRRLARLENAAPVARVPDTVAPED